MYQGAGRPPPEITQMPLKTSQNLTPRQIRAVELIATGISITSAAHQLDVTRETVGGWTRLPAFTEALQGMMTEAREAAKARLQALVEPALAALEKDLNDKDAPRSLRQKAALAVLDRSGLGPSHGLGLEVSGGAGLHLELEAMPREKRLELFERLTGSEGPP